MSNNANNPQLNELVSFIQHDIPGLEDGKYKLEVSQTLTGADGTVISDDSLTTSYKFAVTGDRFRLAKPTEILYSVFPAENASGEFNTVLPSVVFSKTTFPWSRYPTNKLNEQNKRPEPGQDTDEDVPTWLTILLLDEDDINLYAPNSPGFALPPLSGTIGDLFLTSANPKSSLGTNYAYFNKVIDQSKPLSDYMDPGDQVSDVIQLLDIPLALFFKIAPTINDLKRMAHVRKVSLINKPTIPGISDVGEPVGSFSIVFGNRLPNPMKKTYAYLVSLEGLEDFLPTDENGGYPNNQDGFKPDALKVLRLAVLKNWTFYSTGESATFVQQLNALNNATSMVPLVPVGSNKAPADYEPILVNPDLKANTNLRLIPAENALPIVKNALSMGYIPLNHNLRAAELEPLISIDKTVSWYRGPLVPYQTTKAAIKLPVSSPDKVTVFDPTTGMLDTSYAAAWTLGRQLALQDPNFSTALYNWKKGLTLDVINNIESEILAANFSAFTTADLQPQNEITASERGMALPPPTADELLLSGQPKGQLRQKPKSGSFMRNAILSLQKQKL